MHSRKIRVFSLNLILVLLLTLMPVQAAGETLYLTGHPLHGGSVEAPDLRGGAALTLAALAAEGESRITGLRHIDRGYEALEQDLAALGADIRRETLCML